MPPPRSRASRDSSSGRRGTATSPRPRRSRTLSRRWAKRPSRTTRSGATQRRRPATLRRARSTGSSPRRAVIPGRWRSSRPTTSSRWSSSPARRTRSSRPPPGRSGWPGSNAAGTRQPRSGSVIPSGAASFRRPGACEPGPTPAARPRSRRSRRCGPWPC
ncbi:hypothetical protein CRE_16586 [Caenorhabditis remanei]|uniref:Uncharacterized protein n=1 Tax=Caenorhabditis remanei TaxID=31234 RepID=E3NVD5_CAERE|nr:hypothetical protein CRE_16586 [Caenorhabditis remanei]